MQKFCLLPSYIMKIFFKIFCRSLCAFAYFDHKKIWNFSSILELHINLHHFGSNVAGVELRDLKHGLFCVHVRASFIAWCEVQVCWSGSKDFCTPQKDKKHGFICFLPFLYLHFYFPSCIVIHACFFISSACSLRFGSGRWKVNIDQN